MESDPPRILTRSQCDKTKCPCRRRRAQEEPSGDGVETRLETRPQEKPSLLSLPREVHLMILAYLSSRDLHTVRQVSLYFEEIARDPTLWKDYEVLDDRITTKNVISDLKRMPFLKKICIKNRIDCDDILRQISLSNKNLEQLSIINCTGSTSGLYLRANYLTRIARRCRRLHTFQVLGSRFRGLKLFRMMGEAGPRLRALLATTTRAQFQAFARHARHMAEKDRKLLASLPRKRLSTLQYWALGQSSGQPGKIVVTCQDEPLVLVSLEFRPADGTGVIVAATSSTPKYIYRLAGS